MSVAFPPLTVLANELPWEVTRGTLSDTAWGHTDPVQQRVVVPAEVHTSQQKLIFWHEVFHVLRHAYDLPKDKLTEEQIATHYGAALHGFLERNCHLSWRRHGEEGA